MPLHLPSAPAPAVRSVAAALGSPTAVHAARFPSLSAAAGPLVPEQPLALHVLDPVATGAGLPKARLTGWRFLIRCGDVVVAAAETTITPDGWAFSHFCGGPFLASTVHALRQADALPSPYQPRLLSVPGLYMLCLWLHGDLGDGEQAQPAAADVLIPLAPAPPGIAPHRPHRMADLVPLLTHRLAPAPALETAV